MKAGKVCSGSETVIMSLNKAKIKTVILANDLHANTREKVERAARKIGSPVYELFSSQELSKAIGRKRKVLGLTDVGFSKALAKLINEGV